MLDTGFYYWYCNGIPRTTEWSGYGTFGNKFAGRNGSSLPERPWLDADRRKVAGAVVSAAVAACPLRDQDVRKPAICLEKCPDRLTHSPLPPASQGDAGGQLRGGVPVSGFGVLIRMQLGSGFGMMFRMQMMAARGMGMMSGGFGILIAMMFGGLAVVLRGLFVMVRGGLVMFGDLRRVGHG